MDTATTNTNDKSHNNNNGSELTAAGVAKELKQVKTPPEIPHITANFIPLSVIVSNVTHHTYSELLNIIETLPSVSTDLTRKRRFLDHIVKARQEFVKLYVLTKWAEVSKEISQCIDVVSYLAGQQNCYQNLINHMLYTDKAMAGAKVQSPDIETALEVLRTGQPFQKSHNYIPAKPLPPEKVLKTLTNLNVLLSIRLALTEELPPRYRNYKIANGKVKFTVDNCFSVDLGIADDSVDARFFLVDFAFTFDGAQAVPLSVRNKVERMANEMLGTKALSDVFDWLLRFSQNYKLSVIHEHLNDLEGGLWANVLRHSFSPEKSLISMYYWVNRPGPKSIIEIGLLKQTNTIGTRWFKDGQPETCGVQFTPDKTVEQLIGDVIKKHIRDIIHAVYQELVELIGASGEERVTLVGGDKLKIQLTSGRYTVYSIDTQTGRSVLQNPTPIVSVAEKQLNELSDRSKIASILFKLIHLSLQDEITSRATATGWVACTSVFITNEDVRKHFPFDTKLVFALRLPSWSLKWFMLVSIASNGKPKWWISQLEYKDNGWLIKFLEQMHLSSEVYDYKLFDEMANFTTTRIKVYALGRLLQQRGVQCSFTRSKRPTIVVNIDTLLKDDFNKHKRAKKWAHSSLLIVTDDQDMVLVQGRIKDCTALQTVPDESSVSIDPKSGRFSIKVKNSDSVVDAIVSRLQQIERVVSYIELVKSMSMELTKASMSKIGFVYGNGLHVDVLLGETIDLHLSNESPHTIVGPMLKNVLRYDGLLSVIWMLRATLPLYQSLEKVSKFGRVLITPRSVTELKVSFPIYSIDLEVKVKRHNNQVWVFVNDTDPPATPGAKDREKKQSSPLLQELWTKKNKIPGVVPLVCGISSPISKVNHVFDQIQEALMNETVSID